MYLCENIDVSLPSAMSVQWYSQGRQWLSHRLNLLVSRPLRSVLRVCAWLDRHGIRPSCLGLGGPPLLGLDVRPPSLPIVNSNAESTAML